MPQELNDNKEQERAPALSRAAPIALLLAVSLTWSLWLPQAARMFRMALPGSPPSQDFAAYYLAGKALRTDSDPYRYAADRHVSLHPGDLEQYSEEAFTRGDGLSRYIYPPFALPLYAALSRFPYMTARAMWTALALLAHAAAIRAGFLLIAKPLRLGYLVLAFGLTIASQPLLLHLGTGQVDLLVAGLAMLSLLASEKGQRPSAALLLAVAVWMKVSPAVLLAHFVLFRRDVRFLAWFGGWMVALPLLVVWAVPLRLYTDYFREILPTVTSGRAYFQNQTLIRFLVPMGTRVASAGSLAGCAALAAFEWWRGGRGKTGPAHAFLHGEISGIHSFLLCTLAMLLFAGVSWSMAYVWVIVPCALLLVGQLDLANVASLAVACLATLMMLCRPFPVPGLDLTNIAGAVLMASFLAFGGGRGRDPARRD
jgi:hypothetical protein